MYADNTTILRNTLIICLSYALFQTASSLLRIPNDVSEFNLRIFMVLSPSLPPFPWDNKLKAKDRILHIFIIPNVDLGLEIKCAEIELVIIRTSCLLFIHMNSISTANFKLTSLRTEMSELIFSRFESIANTIQATPLKDKCSMQLLKPRQFLLLCHDSNTSP